MNYILFTITGIIVALSFAVVSNAKTANAFYSGRSSKGQAPSLLTLIFSQVTTWIFARSLMQLFWVIFMAFGGQLHMQDIIYLF